MTTEYSIGAESADASSNASASPSHCQAFSSFPSQKPSKDMVSPAPYNAVVIQGPGQASLQKRLPPEVGPREVLISVAYVGVCATDLEVLNGSLGYYKDGLGKYPITPGHEFSGVIARVGEEVTGLEAGMPAVAECIQTCQKCDRCLSENWIGCKLRREVGVLGCDGAYADYVLVPAQFVHPLPMGTGLRKAALCEPAAVVLKGLRRLERVLGPGNGKKYAVVGAGPIGHLCARVLALRASQVQVFDHSPSRLAYFRDSDIKTASALAKLDEYDAIVEATGSAQALRAILSQSRPGSVLLLLGLPYANQQFNFESLVAHDKTIIGSVGSAASDFHGAIDLLPRLDLSSFLEKTVPLPEYEEAWRLFHTRKFLKVMIAVNPD